VPLFDYLTDVAAEHPAAARIVPDRVRRLLEEDEARGGPLVATLRAYADAGLNVAATAAALFVHPNTVHYRLRKVHAATGLDPRRFAGLVELLAAARMPRP
jgi:DNA-binding PucR family transcriptional regulator